MSELSLEEICQIAQVDQAEWVSGLRAVNSQVVEGGQVGSLELMARPG